MTDTLAAEPLKREFRPWVLLLFLAVLVIGTFAPVISYDYVHLDDDVYIFQHPYVSRGVTPESVSWAFRAGLAGQKAYADYWMPLTWLSRILDVEFFGLTPAGPHAVNLLLHTLNVFLLFGLFLRVRRGGLAAAAAAALFAIHPVQAEAVAWISARKDLLSALFMLLAMHGYAAWTDDKIKWKYAAALLAFGAALMSKPSSLALPFLLLVLDLWPLERLGNVKDLWPRVREKAPFWLLLIVFLPIPFYSQAGTWHASAPAGVAGAVLKAPVWYLGKIFFPAVLGIYGASALPSSFEPAAFYAAAALAVITAVLGLAARKWPALFAGWLWYLAALAPSAAAVPLANRFVYLPLAGLAFGLTAFAADVLAPRPRRLLPAALVPLFIFFAFRAERHAASWKDTETLFLNAVKINPSNHVALMNLGNVEAQKGNFDRALDYYQKTTALEPDYGEAYNNIALVLERENRDGEAIEYLRKAAAKAPGMARIYFNLGNLYFKQRRFEEARLEYEWAIRLDPMYLKAYYNLGTLYAWREEWKQAEEKFRAMLAIDPANAETGKALEYVRDARRAGRYAGL